MSRGPTPQEHEPGPQSDGQPERVIASHYRVLRELGRGGMGQVWLADDTVLDRRVAVKELRPSPGLSGAARQAQQARALVEARSAARIVHPNAIVLLEIVEGTAQDEAIYLIMEYAEGPTLKELISSRGPLPAAEVADYGLQLVDVLQVAHALDIVHRDVKPGNVIITPGGQVKLADFGIAYTVGSDRQTTTGVMGTQAYIAPELFEPGSQITPAADLWSLGATLYAAVEGREPFERGATAPTLRAIVVDDLPVPDCEPGLAAAITALLNRDPQQRATIEQTRAALRAPLGERPAAQPAEPLPGTGTQTCQSQVPAREPRPGWNPDAVTGLSSYPQPPVSEEPQRTRRPAIRIGRRTALAVGSLLVAACLAAAGVLAVPRILGHQASASIRQTPVAASSTRTRTPTQSRVGPSSGSLAHTGGKVTRQAAPSDGASHAGSGGMGSSGTGSGGSTPSRSSGGSSKPGGSSPPSQPVEDVFWRGTDGHLWEASGSPGGNLSGPHAITSGSQYVSGPDPMGSGPTAGTDSAGRIYVFWKGIGAGLWEAYWNGSSWAGPIGLGMDTLATAPSVAVAPNGTFYVFWEGSNKNLYEAHGSGTTLSGQNDLSGMGTLGSAPGAAYGGGRVYVSWEGEFNGHLWDTYLNGSSWAGPSEETAGNSIDGGAPTSAVTPGGTAYVFWRGPHNGDIYVAQGPATGSLGAPHDLGAGSLGSPPGAAADASGRLYAYYDGAGKAQLWDMYWTGSAWIPSQARLAASLDGTAPAVVITG